MYTRVDQFPIPEKARKSQRIADMNKIILPTGILFMDHSPFKDRCKITLFSLAHANGKIIDCNLYH